MAQYNDVTGPGDGFAPTGEGDLPTIIQSHQLSEALRRHPGYSLVETFETLMRPWNIDGLSVRPVHRMVAAKRLYIWPSMS